MAHDTDPSATRPLPVTRRTAVKALGAVAVWPYLSDQAAVAFAALQRRQGPPQLTFLTSTQHATLEALTETIIPTDEHSPGSRAARVADYIDLLLAESDEQTQRTWTTGLSLLDVESRLMFRASYVQLNAAQAIELLSAISKNEANPRTPLERFFVTTKDATIRGYYTSEIGIHQDLKYQGNRVLAEFVGCTHPEHGFTK
jgi:Gluconate 2-dehydrogenase subunit 3